MTNISADPVTRHSMFHYFRYSILALVLAGAILGYWRFNVTQHSSTQQIYDNLAVQETRLHSLEQTIYAQEKRISTLEDKVTSGKTSAPVSDATPPAANVSAVVVPEAVPTSNDTQARLDTIEKTLSALKANPAAAIPATSTADVTQILHLLTALHHLSDKVMSGKPYTTELTALGELTNGDEAATKSLGALAPYADSGIPTLASLLKSFDNSVQQLDANDSTPPAGASAWDRFVFNITHIVHIRRIDDAQTGKSADAIVGRAQAHLEQEETEAAIAEIKSLPDDTRSIFSGWLEEAQMSVKAPGIIETIEDRVLSLSFQPVASHSEKDKN